jgi:putative ABC transport system ATP-binding protein
MDKNVGIQIEGLSKRYGAGDAAVDALREVNMSVAPGEVVGLIGPSGSGKTSLLKCLGAVVEPTMAGKFPTCACCAGIASASFSRPLT